MALLFFYWFLCQIIIFHDYRAFNKENDLGIKIRGELNVGNVRRRMPKASPATGRNICYSSSLCSTKTRFLIYDSIVVNPFCWLLNYNTLYLYLAQITFVLFFHVHVCRSCFRNVWQKQCAASGIWQIRKVEIYVSHIKGISSFLCGKSTTALLFQNITVFVSFADVALNLLVAQ